MSAGVKDPAKLIGCVGSSHGGDGDVSLGWQFFRIWPTNEMKICFRYVLPREELKYDIKFQKARKGLFSISRK